MKRMMVQLTDEQIKALKELAKARKISVAKLVRESVAQYVLVTDKDAEQKEKWHRAMKFLNYIDAHAEEFQDIEGKTDISVNHNEYFVRAIEDDLR